MDEVLHIGLKFNTFPSDKFLNLLLRMVPIAYEKSQKDRNFFFFLKWRLARWILKAEHRLLVIDQNAMWDISFLAQSSHGKMGQVLSSCSQM